jgi:hypothetical protein
MLLQTALTGQIQLRVGFLAGNPNLREQFRGFVRRREGNSRPDPRQRALFCPCGGLPPLTAGLCKSCYWRSRHSARYFGGRREEVLQRDGYRCRACGRDEWVGIHHRKPGNNHPSLLITVCAACHARVHRMLSIWKWIPALLVELWVEQHPGSPVQMQFEEASGQLRLQLEGREEVAVVKLGLEGDHLG